MSWLRAARWPWWQAALLLGLLNVAAFYTANYMIYAFFLTNAVMAYYWVDTDESLSEVPTRLLATVIGIALVLFFAQAVQIVAFGVLVFVFFAFAAGGSGLFSAKGVINFLEVSAQLAILAVPVALLMIGGEFDLSIGSMIGFAGVIIAIPSTVFGWPIWLCVLLAFAAAAFSAGIVMRKDSPLSCRFVTSARGRLSRSSTGTWLITTPTAGLKIERSIHSASGNSSALRTMLRECQRNRFLAVCWVIVEPPRRS